MEYDKILYTFTFLIVPIHNILIMKKSTIHNSILKLRKSNRTMSCLRNRNVTIK